MMSCEIPDDHASHNYESDLFGPGHPFGVHCNGVGAARRHWLNVSGDVTCSCGWKMGKGYGQWQFFAKHVEQHIADHPDGDFGPPL